MLNWSPEDIERLVDDSLKEAAEMDADFNGWLGRHVPIWHKLGRDENWIRNRVQLVQSVRQLNHLMIEQGIPEEQRRMLLRIAFSGKFPLPFEKQD